MKSTRTRFIGVAVLVCLFATGMATFLNFYKYKSTFGEIVKSRMLVIGYGIENGIQSSLGLGLNFTELGTLTSVMEREMVADRLITGIDVFSSEGKVLYSTDKARVGTPVAKKWLESATNTKGRQWQSDEQNELVAGISLKNNFDLTVGYLALRYTRGHIDRAVAKMGVRLLIIGVGTFLGASLLAALILIAILRRYERDMRAIDDRIAGRTASGALPPAFAPSVEELRDAITGAEGSLARVRAAIPGA